LLDTKQLPKRLVSEVRAIQIESASARTMMFVLRESRVAVAHNQGPYPDELAEESGQKSTVARRRAVGASYMGGETCHVAVGLGGKEYLPLIVAEFKQLVVEAGDKYVHVAPRAYRSSVDLQPPFATPFHSERLRTRATTGVAPEILPSAMDEAFIANDSLPDDETSG
jgi:hypothetical protein